MLLTKQDLELGNPVAEMAALAKLKPANLNPVIEFMDQYLPAIEKSGASKSLEEFPINHFTEREHEQIKT